VHDTLYRLLLDITAYTGLGFLGRVYLPGIVYNKHNAYDVGAFRCHIVSACQLKMHHEPQYKKYFHCTLTWIYHICEYDILMIFMVTVFKYNPSVHNVVAVNGAGYKGCKASGGTKVYKTGNDRITLARGRNFFICSIAGHCQSGMKIAVTAA
jgi:Plastocyanin-like domain